MAAIVNRQRQCVSVQREAVKALKRLAADVRKYVDYVTTAGPNAKVSSSGLPGHEGLLSFAVKPTSGNLQNPDTSSPFALAKPSEPKISPSSPLGSLSSRPQDLSILNNDALLERFRLDRGTIVYLCELLRPHVANQQMPVESAVCAALAFYATGSLPSTVGDYFGTDQVALKNAVQIVTDALVTVSDQFIKFPPPTSQQQVQQDFFRIAGFPGVVGALGCTHIAIRCPQLHSNLYLNRKRFYSMNLQITATAACRITSAVARFPGSFSCAHVLQHSPLEAFCSRGNLGKGHLIAHSGYPLHHWLLPPLQSPQAEAEVRYNKALTRSHSVVGKTVGLLKARFPCLDRTVLPLQHSPKKSARIILACCVLHNVAVSRNVALPGVRDLGPVDPAAALEDFNCEGDEDTLSDSEEIVALRITEGQQKQAVTIQQFFT
ncbi:putative nuclease HARBI1 [Megalops cyprinoides]|uniref:putative nuclease HARBI1 n=1 Tax=Megalops cyprinoides TaxID=118141 RepID=UPI00186445AE|nr:putative nuclease HARBI1 [Megalops cyprinoides]